MCIENYLDIIDKNNSFHMIELYKEQKKTK